LAFVVPGLTGPGRELLEARLDDKRGVLRYDEDGMKIE
jgi:hypothetical protein